MQTLSVAIITFNEEKNIERCLKAVLPVADEIIVVDSFSTDATKEICQKYGVNVSDHPFEGFNTQKNHAVSLCTHNLILSLDADEVLTEELQNSILAVKEKNTFDGYYLERLTNYCGKWIKYTWSHDINIRLWDRNKGGWNSNIIHEKVQLKFGAKTSVLNGKLLHYSYPTIESHLSQISKFGAISARVKYAKGKKATLCKLLLKPPVKFLKLYFIKRGFLDGYEGFVIAVLSAYAEFIKYVNLHYLRHSKSGKL